MQRTGPHLARALDDVEAARRALALAQQVPWVSAAADGYRAVLADASARTAAVRSGVEAAVLPVAALDLAALDLAVGHGAVPGGWEW
ncbi:hypothetical protein [Cellulomonas sp. URHB0016]